MQREGEQQNIAQSCTNHNEFRWTKWNQINSNSTPFTHCKYKNIEHQRHAFNEFSLPVKVPEGMWYKSLEGFLKHEFQMEISLPCGSKFTSFSQ